MTPTRSFPIVPYVLVAAAFLLAPASAQADGTLELTPFAGYRFGGGFTDNATGVDLDVDGRESFGLILGLRSTPEARYELFYSFQKTELESGGLGGKTPLFDLEIHYLQIGGAYLFPGKRVSPFVSGGFGLTFFSPDRPGSGSETNFSLSLGIGADIPVAKRVGLRVEGRGFLTILPDRTEIFCVSSGGGACDVRVQGDVLGQIELLAGITFGF